MTRLEPMRKIYIVLFSFIFVYLLWPYIAVFSLYVDLKTTDVAGVEERIDWPSLKKDLRTDLDKLVEIKLKDGMITSLPLRSINERAIFNAAVPLLTARESFEPIYRLKFFSNVFTLPIPEPEAQNLLLKTSRTFFSSDLVIVGSNRLIFKKIYLE